MSGNETRVLVVEDEWAIRRRWRCPAATSLPVVIGLRAVVDCVRFHGIVSRSVMLPGTTQRAGP